MVSTNVLQKIILGGVLTSTVLYSSSKTHTDPLSIASSRGFAGVEVFQVMPGDKTENFSVTVSVIITSGPETVQYTLIGPSVPPSQANSEGCATFNNLLPGSYSLKVTNITLGTPLLEAQMKVAACFSGTKIIGLASPMI